MWLLIEIPVAAVLGFVFWYLNGGRWMLPNDPNYPYPADYEVVVPVYEGEDPSKIDIGDVLQMSHFAEIADTNSFTVRQIVELSGEVRFFLCQFLRDGDTHSGIITS